MTPKVGTRCSGACRVLRKALFWRTAQLTRHLNMQCSMAFLRLRNRGCRIRDGRSVCSSGARWARNAQKHAKLAVLCNFVRFCHLIRLLPFLQGVSRAPVKQSSNWSRDAPAVTLQPLRSCSEPYQP